ncbi:MAG: CZB domain-containing protein [Gammaproteobacteria bacterium]|nr:CZB domain-containing protein [Gammaproteobacteria bacterium]
MKKSTVTYWLERLANNNVSSSEAPDWLAPFVASTDSSDNALQITDTAIESARTITGFGREGLRFNQKLDLLVSESIQLSSAIEQMSATAQEIESLGAKVLQRSQQTNNEASLGKEALDRLVKQLDSIESSVRKVGQHAEEFVEKTTAIIKLTSTVNEIADQTNLLALNAAIEAARAGDHGRGFSVVADEVRGLAHRSAEAANEIESIVSGVVNGANAVDKIVNDTVAVLENSHSDRSQLIETISDASASAADNVDLAAQIASAATEQSAVSQDMARGVLSTSSGVESAHEIFERLIKSIAALRDNQTQLLGYFDASKTEMLLRLAKSDHIVWVDKVIRYALFGDSNLSRSELKDHTQCRLGKFLSSSKGQQLASHKLFAELYQDIHPKVHQVGIAIYEAAKSNMAIDELEKRVEQLLGYSQRVLVILDELIRARN